jgi:hypothetical protein
MPKLVLVCAAVLSLAMIPACGDGSDDGDVVVQPRSGVWTFVGSDPVDDTCNYMDLYVDPPGQFTLADNGDGTFTIDDSQNVFDCELDGAKFSCPERLTGENDVGGAFGLDAVVTYSVGVTGTLASDTQMTGRQLVVISCDGADCATVEATVGVMTPCGWAQDFTATAN